MRNYTEEKANRVKFIKGQLNNAGAKGIIYGASGGKDSALVGILCKEACDNTLALIMPCSTTANYGDDISDAIALTSQYKIETRKVDLTQTFEAIKSALDKENAINKEAMANIAPRLRMSTLYAVAASEGRLVAGTGNMSEAHMGYFTKWGDGAFDLNPIGDLTVTEIYEFLAFFDVPSRIITKPPSAGLYDGQTDEGEMGVTYKAIDEYLATGTGTPEDIEIIERFHKKSAHKRTPPITYSPGF